MSIRINLEIGHEASLRTKRTPEGFTHDWEVFVRGCDKADIHNYIEKVVFNLHETFPRPKRIIKEPPYSVKESGYAGFSFPIDIYLRNRDEPKIITFDYDLQLQPSGPSISNVQKEKYVFTSVPDDFKHKLLKGGGIVVSLSTQDNSSDCRPSEEKNQLYNKPNLGGSSSDNKKHKGGAKAPQVQMPNEPRPSSEFVDLFGDCIRKTNQTTGGDSNKAEKLDRGDGKDGRTNKEKTFEKDKSKSKLSPNITKERGDKEKLSKVEKPTEPPERTKKDDKRNKDRGRDKQRDRSKEEKPSPNSNPKREKSPRPKSPSPLTKRSLSPKRRTVTPNPSPKRPPSPSPSPVHQKQHKRSNDSSAKDKEKEKDRSKEDRKKDKKDKRDKEHKENKHKEHRSKDIQPPKKDKEVPKVVEPPKVDKKDKSNRDKEKELPKEQERVQQVQTPQIVAEKVQEKSRESSTSKQIAATEHVPVEKPPKHKHKKKDKDKKQKDKSSGNSKPEREERKDKDDKKDKEVVKEFRKKDKPNKLSIDQFIAEPKSNNFSRSPKEALDLPRGGKSKNIIDDDSSNSSVEDLNDDRLSRDKFIEKLIEPPKVPKEVEKQPADPLKKPPQSQQAAKPLPAEIVVVARKEKPQKPKKDKQNDEDILDGGSKKKKKRKATTEFTKIINHKSEALMNDSSDVDLIVKNNEVSASSEVSEPPEKIPRDDIKEKDMIKEKEAAPSSNGKTLNVSHVVKKESSKDMITTKEDVTTDDAEDYLKILRELQTKIMSLQDNMELQRVVQLIAETGRYEVSDRTFDFDLCLLDRSTVRQLQEFFANLAT